MLCLGRWYSQKAVRFLNKVLKPSIKDVYHNPWKAMKIFTQNGLCSNRENLCSCIWTYFLRWRLCGCFWKYFMFFKERVTASEKISRKCALENYAHLRNVLKWKQLKRKMFMYFWLNYCDENYVERIPTAAKNINHLFHLASEIM